MINEKQLTIFKNLLYTIPADRHDHNSLLTILKDYPEIRFVSLAGVDLSGNATDERIPISELLEHTESFLKYGIQTDGSSVVLQDIATLSDATVVIVPDVDTKWHVDYNLEHIDEETGRPIGTLVIPSFLYHNQNRVCSRSVLYDTAEQFKSYLLKHVNQNDDLLSELNISRGDVEEILLSTATELEFWVKSPNEAVDEEKLHTSQKLKEQYWKRTRGNVRTALERVLLFMDYYQLSPEMGHKEVGGIMSGLSQSGHTNHIVEQLEIDWKYDNPVQTSDNEKLVKKIVGDIFNLYGLEVTFKAKPIEGVAGSGKHVHLSIMAKLKNGTLINLFSPEDLKKDYLTSIGLSSLLGILKNYEIINPFVSSSSDALDRLKPGFEAPVCIVASLGKRPDVPSRNRSVLIGLIKDFSNRYATRFELRAPNPTSNTYLIIAACYAAMLDGIKQLKDKSLEELVIEISKKPGDECFYLERERQYRSEEDVFTAFTDRERNEYFSKPPRTVYENMLVFDLCPEKVDVLTENSALTKEIALSFKKSMIDIWINFLHDRKLEDNMEIVRSCVKLTNQEESDLDVVSWNEINALRWELMKSTLAKKSVFALIREALEMEDYQQASELQVKMNDMIKHLKELYFSYKKNVF